MLPVEIIPKVVAVIDLLREGKLADGSLATLTNACRDVGITYSTFKKYCRANPELQDAFDSALQESYDIMAEALIDIDQIHSDPKMAQVVSKNIQWFLGRRKPKEYGDRVAIDVTVTADKTIVAALLAAKQRLPIGHQQHPQMIDITPEVREEDLY